MCNRVFFYHVWLFFGLERTFCLRCLLSLLLTVASSSAGHLASRLDISVQHVRYCPFVVVKNIRISNHIFPAHLKRRAKSSWKTCDLWGQEGAKSTKRHTERESEAPFATQLCHYVAFMKYSFQVLGISPEGSRFGWREIFPHHWASPSRQRERLWTSWINWLS